MSKPRSSLLTTIIIFLAIISLAPRLLQAASPVTGKILLAVESHGEAWYINPADEKRYYLGRPDDAFKIMRGLAIGVNNKDFDLLEQGKLPSTKVNKLLGRIIIKPEDKGKAYYFEPQKKKLYYLGRPADAFEIMKQTATGVTNNYLNTIPLGSLNISPAAGQTVTATATSSSLRTWRWLWNDQEYSITLALSTSTYEYFAQKPKVFLYTGSLPADWQEQYYDQFLADPLQDKIIAQIVKQLQNAAKIHNLQDDQIADLAAAFIQSIPYDEARSRIITENPNNASPNYPYETLFLNRGVCADKTLLGWLIFHQLGYGVTIMAYPTANHMALGIACPKDNANYPSGYCYIETTQFYHIGLVPQAINGQVQLSSTSLPSLQPTGALANPQFLQKMPGQVYNGLSELKQLINLLQEQYNLKEQLDTEIKTMWPVIQAKDKAIQESKARLDELKNTGHIAEYNQAVPAHNQLVQDYEDLRIPYNQKIAQLNQAVDEYNKLLNFIQPSNNIK